MNQTHGSHGFTLIEMLVSLAILSFTATLLLGGVTTAAHIAGTTQRDAGAVDDVAAAQTILRDKILHLRPVRRLTGGEALMDAGGSETMFDFFAPAPMSGTERGLQKYRLLLTSPGDLILFHLPDLSERADPNLYSITGWQPLVLLRGAAGLSIAYFGATRAQPERRWRTFWRDSGAAPELVRVRVDFRPDDRRAWPDLIVRPGPTVDLLCDPSDASANNGANAVGGVGAGSGQGRNQASNCGSRG